MRCPFANTSVRSGTPVERSAYTSTWRTADCASDGVSRSPQRGPAGHPAGRQPAQLGAAGAGERAAGQLVRQQVGGRRQPHVHVGDGRGALGLVDPAHHPVAPVHEVGLPRRPQRRDAPAARVLPPHPHVVGLAEQLGDAGQRVVLRQRDVAGGLGVPGERGVAGVLHAVQQADRGDVRVGDRQRPHQQRRRDEQEDQHADDAPAVRGRHVSHGTSADPIVAGTFNCLCRQRPGYPCDEAHTP